MKVIRNYLYNAGYQLLLVILPLVTATYISRVLTKTGVGINAYTNSIITYFILFGSLGINLYGNRQIAYQRENKLEMSRTFLGNYNFTCCDGGFSISCFFYLSSF